MLYDAKFVLGGLSVRHLPSLETKSGSSYLGTPTERSVALSSQTLLPFLISGACLSGVLAPRLSVEWRS